MQSKLLINKAQLAKVLSVHSQENIMEFIDLYYDLGGEPGQMNDALIDRIISHEANDFKVLDLYKGCSIRNNATQRIKLFKSHANRMKQLLTEQGFKIQSIRSLLGNAGDEVLLCGILFKGHGNEPFIEDDTGQIRLILSEIVKTGIGYYFDSNIVLLKGKYIRDGKIFKATHILQPPIIENMTQLKEREVISKKLSKGYCLFFYQIYLDVATVQDDFVFTVKKYLERNSNILCMTLTDCFKTNNPTDQRSAIIHFVRRLGTELPSVLRDVHFVFVPPTIDILPTAQYIDYVFNPVMVSFDHIYVTSNPCVLDCFGRSIALFSYDFEALESFVPAVPNVSKSTHLSNTIVSQMRLLCFKQQHMLFSQDLFFKYLPSLIVIPTHADWFEQEFKSNSTSVDSTIVNNTGSFANKRTWTAYQPYEHKLEYCQLPRKKS